MHLATIAFTLALINVACGADQPGTDRPPEALRIVVLPFQNVSGDAAWDDWGYALPACVRLCLGAAEFTDVPRGKTIQAAMQRAKADAVGPMDARLASQIAHDMEADVVAWGNFARQTNFIHARLTILRTADRPSSAQIEVSSSNWVGLAESLVARVAKHLERRINNDDLRQLTNWFGGSEKALALAGKAIAMEMQALPAADREKVLREALKEDPRCGLARMDLLSLLPEQGRTNELADEIKDFLKQQPDFCSAHLGLAWLNVATNEAAAEREMREALRVHPGCRGAARGFFMLNAHAGNWKTAEKILDEIHRQRPDQIETAILLACARAQNGDTGGAWTLLAGINRLPEEDEALDKALISAASSCGRFYLVGLELMRLGQKAAESQDIRDDLATVRLFRKEDTGTNAPITRPHAFTPAELNAELDRRLSADERSLVSEPLVITPEITAEARRLTVGLSNHTAQALALFAEVARRGRGPGDGGARSASESLSASERSEERLSCQEHAKLFVALARSLGLDSYMVHIERGADGLPCYHDCAALFLDGLGLLVDPTWRVFGINHEVFTVMDDLQAIAHHTMQPNQGPLDPRRLRAMVKLNPEDRWTQLQFVRGMARAGEFAVAEEQLRKVRSASAESWDVHEATAELEIARERWKAALNELQHALVLSPSNAVVHERISRVYDQLGDLAKSAEHMESALALDRGEMTKDYRREASAQQAAIKAFTRIKAGDSSGREELQRLAEAGDVSALLVLARACFEERFAPRIEEGLRWSLKAAELGNAQAQVYYARSLLTYRRPAATDEAVLWFTRAAEQGDGDAQYSLGLILYEGKLVARDNVAAGQWILLAIKSGNSDAKRLLREMELFLSADELAAARKRADTFKPTATKAGAAKN